MAVLSTQGPMAVLSRQKQPDGQTSRFQRQIAFSLLSRTISLSAAGPSYFQQKHAQWPFYQRRPNGRFMQAEATGWPDLQISTTNCIFAIIPHDQFTSGRAKLFSAKASPMAVLSTQGPMAVLSKQKQPDGQTSRFQATIPHDQFMSGRAKLFSAKAGPMAVLSTRGPMAILSMQKQPDGQTSRFQRQIAFSLLSRTISLSAAGPSYSQQKQANGHFINARPNGRFIKAEATGWPDLQISATNCIFAIIPHDQFIINARPWPFYECRSNRMARPPDFNDKLHFRTINLSAAGPSYSQQKQAQWPF